MKKHLFSFLMVLVLSLALFPAAVSAADGYSIGDVAVEGAAVSVRVTAAADCALFVGLYNENGKMMESRSENITGKSGEQSVSVQFNAEIINGVYAKAFLVNPDTCAPLCEGVDSKFHAEEYALIERIAIETTVNHVTTKTSSMLGVAGTTVMTMPENSETLQLAYNQCKDAVGNSSWDAQAQLRFSNGTRRTVTLDDSKNYRTDAASDASNYAAIQGLETDADGFAIDGDGNRYYVTGNNNGNGDGNWIAEPFTAGHIVRITSTSSGYKLHRVDGKYTFKVSHFSLDSAKVYETTDTNEDGVFDSDDTRNEIIIPGTSTRLLVDSETHFVVEDITNNTYKSYVGSKNVPDIKGNSARAFIYHRDGLAKLIFITNVQNAVYKN